MLAFYINSSTIHHGSCQDCGTANEREMQFRRLKTLHQKIKLLESLKSSSHTAWLTAETVSKNSISLFYTQRKNTQAASGLSIWKKEKKIKRVFSPYNCSILSAFQFSSEVPSLGTDFLGAMTQSNNIEPLHFRSFPKFPSYWWSLSSCHNTEQALVMSGHSHWVVSQPSGKLSENRNTHRNGKWEVCAAAVLLGDFCCYRSSQFSTFTNLYTIKSCLKNQKNLSNSQNHGELKKTHKQHHSSLFSIL